MFTIDVTVKNTPMTLSVQRKEKEDALKVYGEIVEAMGSGTKQVLELTCEKQPDKLIAVLSEYVCAVILSQKSSTTASGKAPGFLIAAEKE